jgi:hypothetical protein
MKWLRKQGLPPKQISIVFQAIIISQMQYASSAWGGSEKSMLYCCERINQAYAQI